MKLDVVKQFSTRSDRVKGIDFHPTEPWILTTLYNGKIEIWSYATNSLVKSIQVTELPVRAGKFIARKNWIVVGSDDFQIRVYNYNTGEKVTQFEAHPDYIRSIAVHPSKPYILTSSDDLTIKLWNWDHNWKLEQTFEGHQHYVMSVNFNPKDPNTFASACLDRTVKIWSLGSSQPNFTLIAHESKGVNYVDYYPQADKPYLITSSDDKTIKVWDYQTKSCVATLEGHLSNVSFAIFHPELPIIVSGSEDGTIRFWNSNTFKLEKSINYSLERAWCIGILPKSNVIAAGFDSGFVIIKLGSEEPLFSMDSNNKLIYAKNSEVYQSVIKPSSSEGLKDGESLNLQQRDLGSIEIFPQTLSHSPNGRYAAVCGDGEYIVYTALAWRSKSYGSALDFVWNSHDSSAACPFAIRESGVSVKIYKNFQEYLTLDLIYQADKIFTGSLLGVKSEGCISFYDWEHGKLVRRVDLDDDIADVIWSDNGELLAIITTSNLGEISSTVGVKKNNETYFLSYNHELFEEALTNGELDAEEGAESAFEVLYTLPTSESILSGKFIGDVFVYTTGTTNRLNYFVGGEVINLGHFDRKFYIIGYKASDGKLYLIDKSFDVVSWYVNAEVLELQTLVMRGDLEQFATHNVVDEESGEEVPDLSTITLDNVSEEYSQLISRFTKTELNQLSRFFEKLGYLALSFSLSQDFDSKFQLSLSTGNLKQAYDLLSAQEKENPSLSLANSTKWKKLGDLALTKWNIKLAQESFWLAKDYSSLLLLLSSSQNKSQLIKLAEVCEAKGKYNIAWQSWWLVGDVGKCFDLLITSERYTEAVIFGKNYGVDSEKLTKAIELWKQTLHKKNKSKVANRLIDNFSNLQTNGSTGAPLIDLENKQDDEEEKEEEEKIEDEAGASEVQHEEVDKVEAEIQQDDEVTAEDV
ncbi:beta'-coat protein of the COPI coatomer, putative [Candida dubliniensis CD36]|uniref:Coatomer subunit beta' n=1 Tax=Candida dubliniensis (strain CD36 / ATCC MYA-646 / CBS 7987 / NCPF 3949 / NRRL Y-17841) TaxID=573826 RepID=B9WIT8_CANDC|nr:beta'-coat protein of the COPI coatomer, putative [Candida dubliniensis CD36]CAX41156.1 beta'-coat protein of the COPI coatomer, putative [Candida dubliniensis CD36]